MQIKYFQTSWNDIKNSPGWFGKMCLLALVGLIPIFGQIVLFGYLYGWAREIAWGTHQPMPSKIFGNDDGKFWRRGWFLLVISFVFQLVPFIVMSIGSSMQGAGMYATMSTMSNGASPLGVGSAASTGIGSLIYLAGCLLSLFVSILFWIAAMRTAIYDRLSAGFQIGKIWRMFRHDTSGIMRVFGMNLILALILGVIVSIVIFVLTIILVLAGVGTHAGMMNGASDGSATALIASLGGVYFVIILAVVYFAMVASVFVETVVARAMGYWTMQFDVPRWRGQDDPMPFELAGAAAGAAYGAYPYQGNSQVGQTPGQMTSQVPGQASAPDQSWQAQVPPAEQVPPVAQVQPVDQPQSATAPDSWQTQQQAETEVKLESEDVPASEEPTADGDEATE